MYATAGEEALSAKGVYVTQGTAVWDFQPETTLAMTYLHIGEKDKTAANLIVSNGVINSTGSIGFDNSNGSIWFVGTKATFAEKFYPSAVGKNTITLTDCASSSRWQTLIASTTGEIRNLTLDQVEVTTARNKLSKLRLVQDDDDKVTALEFRLQDASGTTIIIL